MKTVFNIFEEIEQANGTNAKKEILFLNKNNSLLKNAFIAALDSYTVYNINKYKAPKPIARNEENDDNLVSELLNNVLQKLSTREITGNAAKDFLQNFLQNTDEIQQKWIQRIILKKLRLGVQDTTVNKVWTDAVKTFKVSLAETLESSFKRDQGITILGQVNYPVRVEPKLDGLRCVAIKNNGNVVLYKRSGNVITTLPKIVSILENIDCDNFVLDGEAMGADWNESASVINAYKSKHDDSNIVFNVFDAMSLKDWQQQKCEVAYVERCKFVQSVVDLCKCNNIKQVNHIIANNEIEIKQFFKKCMDEGYEGVMLKRQEASYSFDRSDNILKLKPFVSYEGVIVGGVEGSRGSSREGLFSGFSVMLTNNIVTKVGSGLNDELRARVQLEGIENYIGKIVEIEAQPDPLTVDGLSVDGKARFPVFLRFRDKSDVSNEVIELANKYVFN